MSGGLKLGELAERIGAELIGDAGRAVLGAATLETAGTADLAFLASQKYRPYLANTRAAAVIVARKLGELEEIPEGTAILRVDDAHVALAAALPLLYPPKARSAEISQQAIIEDGVELGEGVSVEPFAVVRKGSRLGDGVLVGSHSVVGEDADIGDGTEIKPHVTIYPGTIIGARCLIQAGARIGADGFGYVFHEGEHRRVPQVGSCVLEDDVDVGANTTIDRGSVGETRIGAGTRIDNLVHIAHNVRIGKGCIIVAQVGIAGSTTIGQRAALGGQVGVIGHVSIGDGAQVAAQSGVANDVPAGQTWFGSPARPRLESLRANAALMKLPELVRRVRKLEGQADGGSD